MYVEREREVEIVFQNYRNVFMSIETERERVYTDREIVCVCE